MIETLVALDEKAVQVVLSFESPHSLRSFHHSISDKLIAADSCFVLLIEGEAGVRAGEVR